MEQTGATSRPMAAAHYHHILFGSRYVFYDVKITIIIIVGGVIIIACLAYIFVQCRVKSRSRAKLCSKETFNSIHRLREEEEDEEKEEGEDEMEEKEDDVSLTDSDTTQSLLPYPQAIQMKVRKEREFYV